MTRTLKSVIWLGVFSTSTTANPANFKSSNSILGTKQIYSIWIRWDSEYVYLLGGGVVVEVDETGKCDFQVNVDFDVCEGQVVFQTAGGFVVVQLFDVESLDAFYFDVVDVDIDPVGEMALVIFVELFDGYLLFDQEVVAVLEIVEVYEGLLDLGQNLFDAFPDITGNIHCKLYKAKLISSGIVLKFY